MYGVPPAQASPHVHANQLAPHVPQHLNGASTSLQALSRAALGHAGGSHLAHSDRPRTLLPAMTLPTASGSGARSASPSSAMQQDDDDRTDSTPAPTTKSVKGAGKQNRKRGRKRIEEDTAAIDANDTLDADAKRKLQNRAAQRAFRERKERHVVDLEEKVVQQEAELAQCRALIDQLRIENEALRRGENPAPTPVGNDASPLDVKPALETRFSNGASPSFHHILNESSDVASEHAAARYESASTSPSIVALPDVPATSTSSLPRNKPRRTVSPPRPIKPSNAYGTTYLEPSFDFDAPFDFSESIELPPLFASLLDDLSHAPSTTTTLSYGGPLTAPRQGRQGSGMAFEPGAAVAASISSSTSTDLNDSKHSIVADDARNDDLDADADADADPDGDVEDDDGVVSLVGRRIPCDKPECDFTAVSCALPIPWRPPNAPTGSDGDPRDLWVAQKCWAKLVSHPLFDQCDTDDLCQELRDKTRCSPDGRLVCHKNDVSDIFRTIPQKAKVRQVLRDETT